MMHKAATVISRLFDPLVTATVLMGIAFRVSGMETIRMLLLFVSVYILVVGIPIFLLVGGLRQGKISNWDLSERRERIVPMLVELCLILVSGMLMYHFGNAFLFHIVLVFFAWFTGFFAITLFWKISGHVATNTLVAGILMGWFGVSLWPLLFIIPFIAWSRVVRKNHTVAQVIGGLLYSVIFLALGNRIGFL